jgi:hypothetical protein
MVAFFVLLLLIAGVVLVWAFAIRDSGGGGDLGASPATIDFGDQDLNRRSAAQSVTIDNDTDDAVRITSIAVEGENASDFQVTDETTCPTDSRLDAQASCSIGVRFRPRAREERQAVLVVRAADREAPLRVALIGTGVGEATVVLETTRLDLGTVLIGKSRTRTVSITNAGNAPLAIEEILFDGDGADDYRLGKATDCSTEERLKAGGSCTIAVTFRPRAGGQSRAELVIVHDAEGSPSGVELTGKGRGEAAFELEPSSLDFGDLDVGELGDVKTVTITSTGTAPVALATIDLSGADAADWAIGDTSTCAEDVELEPGDSCTIDLSFTPGAEGERSAVLEVETPGGLSSGVDLTGSGLAEAVTTTETTP